MDYDVDFVAWLNRTYQRGVVNNAVWGTCSMQTAYLDGEAEGRKEMRRQVLKIMSSHRERSPAVQKLYQEIEGLG